MTTIVILWLVFQVNVYNIELQLKYFIIYWISIPSSFPPLSRAKYAFHVATHLWSKYWFIWSCYYLAVKDKSLNGTWRKNPILSVHVVSIQWSCNIWCLNCGICDGYFLMLSKISVMSRATKITFIPTAIWWSMDFMEILDSHENQIFSVVILGGLQIWLCVLFVSNVPADGPNLYQNSASIITGKFIFTVYRRQLP